MERKRIPFDDVRQELTRILLAAGLDPVAAGRCAEIFTENTCDGVESHGLNRFPSFVKDVRTGVVKTGTEPEPINSFGALEQWDGNRGIGLLNAEKAMNRAIKLSRNHGIGCVGMRNTNHWMRAGTYALAAAREGCIGVCWTNTIALMPPWGATGKKIGNNPVAVCIPREEGPVLLDMAMSQFSMGKLDVFHRLGKNLPVPGGYDENGELTVNPGDILNSGRALPIGYWKGSGLAIVLDLMAALISDGDSTREITLRDRETGVSQIFIAVNLAPLSATGNIEEKVNSVIQEIPETPADEGVSVVRYPGQGMLASRKENLEKGIPVDPGLWEEIRKM